jgi:hypothetical protein
MDNFEREERGRERERKRLLVRRLDILSGDGQTCIHLSINLPLCIFDAYLWRKLKSTYNYIVIPCSGDLQHRSTPDDDDLRRRRLQQHRTHLLLLTHATKNQSPLPSPNRPHHPRHPPRRLRPIHILLHTPPRTSSSWTMCEEGFIALSYVQEFVWDEGGGCRWKWRR